MTRVQSSASLSLMSSEPGGDKIDMTINIMTLRTIIPMFITASRTLTSLSKIDVLSFKSDFFEV